MTEPILLQAGPLSMRFVNGELRTLTAAGQEVVRRVYPALRDRNWDTLPGVLSDLEIFQAEDSFRVSFTCRHQRGEVDFAWQGTLTGDANGKLSYQLDGAARSTFWKNRIGLCVLIPPGCAGAAARVLHSDGQQEDCRLPEQVSCEQPVPPFERMRGAGYRVGDGIWVELGLEGDLFEMEDQRNWSDASFKIYGTPLRQPFPVEIQAGTAVRQTVTVQVSGQNIDLGDPLRLVALSPTRSVLFEQGRTSWEGRVLSGKSYDKTFTQLTLYPGQATPLPEIGLEMAGHGQELSAREIQLLRALHPGHLRVDLDLTQDGWQDRLALGAAQSRQLAAPLWLGLLMDENSEAALALAVEEARALDAHPATWIVLSKQEFFWGGTPLAPVLEMAGRHLSGGKRASGTRASGTRADLIFLLRSPVPDGSAQAVALRITPQVHVFDDEALVESLGVQAVMVRSARAAQPGMAVWVSPLSLRPGYNPYASGPAAPVPEGELPENVDPRQRELFAAAWTAGSLAALADGGAGAVTAYETTGWRGVMERDGGPALPGRFGAKAGEVFPLYHVLADAGEFRGGEVLKVSSSDGLRSLGLALRKLPLARLQGRDQLRVVVASFGRTGGHVLISGLPDGKWRLRRLDESRLSAARFDPQTYRGESAAAPVRAGEIELVFDGVGMATLDWEE